MPPSPPPRLGTILSQVSNHSKREYTPPLDPFGWEALRAEEQAAEEAFWEALRAGEQAAGEAFWEALQPEETAAIDPDQWWRERETWHLHDNAERILFALVELAADPHLTQAPAITVEEWAQYFNIRPTQVTFAFRRLHEFGIPKPPAPVPLDGLPRFLADKLRAHAREWGVRAAESIVGDGATHMEWIEEYFKSQSGGDA